MARSWHWIPVVGVDHRLTYVILETAVGREKDVHGIDVHGEYEKLMVTYMDVGYADNAGAITCHLIGDERFFRFPSDAAPRCVKSLYILSGSNCGF